MGGGIGRRQLRRADSLEPPARLLAASPKSARRTRRPEDGASTRGDQSQELHRSAKAANAGARGDALSPAGGAQAAHAGAATSPSPLSSPATSGDAARAVTPQRRLQFSPVPTAAVRSGGGGGAHVSMPAPHEVGSESSDSDGDVSLDSRAAHSLSLASLSRPRPLRMQSQQAGVETRAVSSGAAVHVANTESSGAGAREPADDAGHCKAAAVGHEPHDRSGGARPAADVAPPARHTAGDFAGDIHLKRAPHGRQEPEASSPAADDVLTSQLHSARTALRQFQLTDGQHSGGAEPGHTGGLAGVALRSPSMAAAAAPTASGIAAAEHPTAHAMLRSRVPHAAEASQAASAEPDTGSNSQPLGAADARPQPHVAHDAAAASAAPMSQQYQSAGLGLQAGRPLGTSSPQVDAALAPSAPDAPATESAAVPATRHGPEGRPSGDSLMQGGAAVGVAPPLAVHDVPRVAAAREERHTAGVI